MKEGVIRFPLSNGEELIVSQARPLFVLNVGAQKSGTSWLRQTLLKLKFANLGFMKEYHIWDQTLPEEVLGHDFTEPVSRKEAARVTLRRMMLADERHYFGYFQQLVSPSLRITGDFTPSYSLLPEEELRTLTRKLVHAGFDVVVVYLMRDPVARCWSSFRSYHRDRQEALPTTGLTEIFRNFYQAPRARERTRYEQIIPKLLRLASQPESESLEGSVSVVIEGYERLMQGQTKELAAALRLNPKSLLNEAVLNASPAQTLPESEAVACADFFAEAYAYCRAHYPEVTKHWRHIF